MQEGACLKNMKTLKEGIVARPLSWSSRTVLLKVNELEKGITLEVKYKYLQKYL